VKRAPKPAPLPALVASGSSPFLAPLGEGEGRGGSPFLAPLGEGEGRGGSPFLAPLGEGEGRGGSRLVLAAALGVAFTLVARSAAAAVVTVADGASLAGAIATAKPGDTITLLDGTYSLPKNVVANAVGTAAAPIQVAAQHLHGATVVAADGANEAILVQGPYWSFDGIDFSGGNFGLHLSGNGSFASLSHALFTNQLSAAVRADCGGATANPHCDSGQLLAVEITRSVGVSGADPCVWAGIELVGAQGWSVRGVSIHDVAFDTLVCVGLNSVYGISVRGNSSNVVVDSVAIDGAAIGLALGPQSNPCDVRGSVALGTGCSIPTPCEVSSSLVSNAVVIDAAFEGVLLANACAVNLHNATLWNNGAESARSVETSGSGSDDLSNIIFNVAATLVSGVKTTGGGNLMLPTTNDTSWFIDAAAGNFRLLAGAPAIDSGITLADVPFDFDGIQRPQGTAYDVGAFERPVGGYPDGGLPLEDGGTGDGGAAGGGGSGGGTIGSGPTTGGGQTQPQKTSGCDIGLAGSSGVGAVGLGILLALLLALVVRKRARG
jgi:hypothetical protein